MGSYLHITSTGNLLRDPELKYDKNGAPFALFSIGLNKRSDDGDDFGFVDVVTYKSPEIAIDMLHTGSSVLVTGRSWPKSYNSNGKTTNGLKCWADSWQALDPIPKTNDQGHNGRGSSNGSGRGSYQNGNGSNGRRNQQQPPPQGQGQGRSNGNGYQQGSRSQANAGARQSRNSRY